MPKYYNVEDPHHVVHERTSFFSRLSHVVERAGGYTGMLTLLGGLSTVTGDLILTKAGHEHYHIKASAAATIIGTAIASIPYGTLRGILSLNSHREFGPHALEIIAGIAIIILGSAVGDAILDPHMGTAKVVAATATGAAALGGALTLADTVVAYFRR